MWTHYSVIVIYYVYLWLIYHTWILKFITILQQNKINEAFWLKIMFLVNLTTWFFHFRYTSWRKSQACKNGLIKYCPNTVLQTCPNANHPVPTFDNNTFFLSWHSSFIPLSQIWLIVLSTGIQIQCCWWSVWC